MQVFSSKIILDYETSRSLWLYVYQSDFQVKPEADKFILHIDHPDLGKVMEFKYPFIFPIPQEDTGDQTLTTQISPEEDIPDYLMVLLEAGQAALGHFIEGKLDSHKVIRKYMVRAKQGKLQLSHLKTKGKSKLGSRIRLAQSKEFFEEINEKLLEWEVEDVDLILYNSSIQLWNGLFDAPNPPPFAKRDTRLRKIPKDLPSPTFELLHETNQWALQGELTIFKKEFRDILDKMED
ncbi:MAG: hypothetical protein NW226_20555 [Microscillaceae bacterium]|nr:hypothetical protein [Microscillaceae bacterium]